MPIRYLGEDAVSVRYAGANVLDAYYPLPGDSASNPNGPSDALDGALRRLTFNFDDSSMANAELVDSSQLIIEGHPGDAFTTIVRTTVADTNYENPVPTCVLDTTIVTCQVFGNEIRISGTYPTTDTVVGVTVGGSASLIQRTLTFIFQNGITNGHITNTAAVTRTGGIGTTFSSFTKTGAANSGYTLSGIGCNESSDAFGIAQCNTSGNVATISGTIPAANDTIVYTLTGTASAITYSGNIFFSGLPSGVTQTSESYSGLTAGSSAGDGSATFTSTNGNLFSNGSTVLTLSYSATVPSGGGNITIPFSSLSGSNNPLPVYSPSFAFAGTEPIAHNDGSATNSEFTCTPAFPASFSISNLSFGMNLATDGESTLTSQALTADVSTSDDGPAHSYAPPQNQVAEEKGTFTQTGVQPTATVTTPRTRYTNTVTTAADDSDARPISFTLTGNIPSGYYNAGTAITPQTDSATQNGETALAAPNQTTPGGTTLTPGQQHIEFGTPGSPVAGTRSVTRNRTATGTFSFGVVTPAALLCGNDWVSNVAPGSFSTSFSGTPSVGYQWNITGPVSPSSPSGSSVSVSTTGAGNIVGTLSGSFTTTVSGVTSTWSHSATTTGTTATEAVATLAFVNNNNVSRQSGHNNGATMSGCIGDTYSFSTTFAPSSGFEWDDTGTTENRTFTEGGTYSQASHAAEMSIDATTATVTMDCRTVSGTIPALSSPAPIWQPNGFGGSQALMTLTITDHAANCGLINQVIVFGQAFDFFSTSKVGTAAVSSDYVFPINSFGSGCLDVASPQYDGGVFNVSTAPAGGTTIISSSNGITTVGAACMPQ